MSALTPHENGSYSYLANCDVGCELSSKDTGQKKCLQGQIKQSSLGVLAWVEPMKCWIENIWLCQSLKNRPTGRPFSFRIGAGRGSRTLVSCLGSIHNSRYTIPALTILYTMLWLFSQAATSGLT